MVGSFRNKHAGQRCAILCNGPSIKEFPFGKWKDTVIGINRSWIIADARYHCFIDAEQLVSALKARISLQQLFVGRKDELNTDRDRGEDLGKRILIQNVEHKGCHEIKGPTGRKGLTFSFDLERDAGAVSIPNTPFMALEIAAYLGFKRIDFW